MSELQYNHDNFSVQDMWNVLNYEGNINFGVAGYESPKIYIDHRKIKTDRELYKFNQEVWAGKQKYPKPKLRFDKNDNPIVPQKINFIDEIIKQSHSSFSKEKFEKYVDFLKGKGKSLEEIEGIKKNSEPVNKDVKNSKIYKHDRCTYIGEIMKIENKRYTVPEEFQEKINQVKEKHAKYKSPYKNDIEEMMAEYKGKTSLR
jgi:hypothetical protein